MDYQYGSSFQGTPAIQIKGFHGQFASTGNLKVSGRVGGFDLCGFSLYGSQSIGDKLYGKVATKYNFTGQFTRCGNVGDRVCEKRETQKLSVAQPTKVGEA
jgi:hypothetical protein